METVEVPRPLPHSSQAATYARRDRSRKGRGSILSNRPQSGVVDRSERLGPPCPTTIDLAQQLSCCPATVRDGVVNRSPPGGVGIGRGVASVRAQRPLGRVHAAQSDSQSLLG